MWNLGKLLKVVDPEPVLINHQACLRARHQKSQCRACSEICPHQAVGYAKGRLTVESELCTKCGLCVGACPTAALQVRGLDEAALEGATRVRCARATGEGVEIPCLGYLTADQIVDLGSRCPGLELAAGDCAACPLARGAEQGRQALESAGKLLRALGVSQLPTWISAAGSGAQDQRHLTRRELLGFWRTAAVQTGKSLLPERNVNPVKLPAQVPARRLRWMKRFPANGEESAVHWPTRSVAEGCIGCNICVAFCPTGALASQEEDGTWALSFQAAACVDCKTCLHLCPRKVIGPGADPTVDELLSGTRRGLAMVASCDRPGAAGWRPLQS